MTDWSEIKNGDIVKCGDDTLEVIEWRGEKYLAEKHDMWAVSEFDPKDWEMETYGKWFESDIDIVEIDGELYALAENNGEHYYGWKCIDRWTADPDGKEYTITPVYDWSKWNEEDGEFQDSEGNPIDGLIGYEMTA